MGRIIAIDYGKKRTGLAVTDTLQIVPGGLCTIRSSELFSYLKKYLSVENVDKIVVGHPRQMNNLDSESMIYIRPIVEKLKKEFPQIDIIMYDERFTSVLAQEAIREAGIKKRRRQMDKGLVDEISAVILLRDYLDSIINKNF